MCIRDSNVTGDRIANSRRPSLINKGREAGSVIDNNSKHPGHMAPITKQQTRLQVGRDVRIIEELDTPPNQDSDKQISIGRSGKE